LWGGEFVMFVMSVFFDIGCLKFAVGYDY
jgi:hypothetical protein